MKRVSNFLKAAGSVKDAEKSNHFKSFEKAASSFPELVHTDQKREILAKFLTWRFENALFMLILWVPYMVWTIILNYDQDPFEEF